MSATVSHPFGNEKTLLVELERVCESPIEVSFLHGLVTVCRRYELTLLAGVGWDDPPPQIYPLTPCYGWDPYLRLRLQPTVDGYRFDFMLQMADGKYHTPHLVIECDGHDYHERTKEQAKRDRARDRELQSWDLPFFRFTGQELYRGAPVCADECLDYLTAKLDEVHIAR